MKIEEYTVAVKGLYPRKRVRDNLGKAGWITEINKSGFLLTRYRYDAYPSWYSDDVELDDSIRVGDDVTV